MLVSITGCGKTAGHTDLVIGRGIHGVGRVEAPVVWGIGMERVAMTCLLGKERVGPVANLRTGEWLLLRKITGFRAAVRAVDTEPPATKPLKRLHFPQLKDHEDLFEHRPIS